MRKLVYAGISVLLITIASFKKESPLNRVHPLTTPGHPVRSEGVLLTGDTLLYPEETHLSNIQQLTFGGDNAEAYWSYDGKYIVFQRTNTKEGITCDQIFMGKVPQTADEKFEYKMVSTGKGRTTCAILQKTASILFMHPLIWLQTVAHRFRTGKNMAISISGHLYDSYDIFMADLNGKIVKQLTNAKGYDAEATLSPDGKQNDLHQQQRR